MSITLAIGQLAATNDLDHNLSQMKTMVAEAAKKGAKLVAFPEMAYFIGKKQEHLPLLSRHDEILQEFCGWAREYAIDLIPGTMKEPSPNAEKYYNTLHYIDAQGTPLAKYRKIFLFKANLPDRNYDESQICEPGSEIVTLKRDWGVIGFSICYDLRFPELYRALTQKGARFLFVPSAFTVPTGKAHWETLLRARAIENQSYVLAPGLVGACGDDRITYGHSLAVNPWGEILINLGQKTGLGFAKLPNDFSAYAQKIDVFASRRADVFP